LLSPKVAYGMVALMLSFPESMRPAVVCEALDTRAEAVNTIRGLIERIEIRPGRQRGRCEITVVGALAQILAFAQAPAVRASSGTYGTSLMVAGIGFEPMTFRL
jgi:hypothetical protein